MRYLLALLLPVVLASAAPGQAPAAALFKIHSHGLSGTAIASGPGWTYILSAAHGFEGTDRTAPIHITGRIVPGVPPTKVPARLVAVDYQADLALILLHTGPFPTIPVAPAGFQPTEVAAAGFDKMCWPTVCHWAHPVRVAGGMTWTVERPIPGRSGGPLYDNRACVLIGVCHGYEDTPGGRGMYVSHDAVLAFLGRQARSATRPQVSAGPAVTCPPAG